MSRTSHRTICRERPTLTYGIHLQLLGNRKAYNTKHNKPHGPNLAEADGGGVLLASVALCFDSFLQLC